MTVSTTVTPATPTGVRAAGVTESGREFRGVFVGYTVGSMPVERPIIEYSLPGGGTRRSSFVRAYTRAVA